MNGKNNNLNNTASIRKVTPPSKKKGMDKVTLAIVILAVILVSLLGTQFVLNPPSKNSSAKSYSYFSNLDNTFSAQFLDQLNSYRGQTGLSPLERTSDITSGSSVTFTIPNLSSYAEQRSDDTEAKLAKDALQTFLDTAQNKQIATASVSKIYLNTEVNKNVLTMTVKVPYES